MELFMMATLVPFGRYGSSAIRTRVLNGSNVVPDILIFKKVDRKILCVFL